jgi:mRNA interferase MazF
MKLGEIYDARLEPVEGSEQGGTRPIIVVSRDAINAYSPVVLAVPCTTYQNSKKIYPTQVLIKVPEAELSKDSIAIADQVRVLSKQHLLRLRSILEQETLNKLDQALLIALRSLWTG